MVTIINYKNSQTTEGKEFFSLVVQGGVETVQSKETGRFYLTSRRATVSSTFNEETCKSLLQTKMPGAIEKVQVEPYEYTIEESGEVITLEHSWRYNPQLQSMEEAVFEGKVDELEEA